MILAPIKRFLKKFDGIKFPSFNANARKTLVKQFTFAYKYNQKLSIVEYANSKIYKRSYKPYLVFERDGKQVIRAITTYSTTLRVTDFVFDKQSGICVITQGELSHTIAADIKSRLIVSESRRRIFCEMSLEDFAFDVKHVIAAELAAADHYKLCGEREKMVDTIPHYKDMRNQTIYTYVQSMFKQADILLGNATVKNSRCVVACEGQTEENFVKLMRLLNHHWHRSGEGSDTVIVGYAENVRVVLDFDSYFEVCSFYIESLLTIEEQDHVFNDNVKEKAVDTIAKQIDELKQQLVQLQEQEL